MTRNDVPDESPALLLPLPGPLDERPTGLALADARAMLAAAVLGLDLGEYDRRILAWFSSWDQPTVAAMASIIHRARLEDPR